MTNSNEDDIYYFLRDLKDFQSRIKIHSFDFNKIKDNQRFLQFACKVLHEKEGDGLILDIKNLYFQLLYLAYTIPFYSKILDQLKIYIIDLTKYTQNSTVILNHHALIFLYGLKSILMKPQNLGDTEEMHHMYLNMRL